MKSFHSLLLVCAFLLIGLAVLPAPAARAAFTFTLNPVGGGVMINGSGSLDLTDLSTGGTGANLNGFNSSSAFVGIGASGNTTTYTGLNGPTNFGSGAQFSISNFSGSIFVLVGSNQQFRVFTGYAFGSPSSGSATHANQTFASMGITPGTYTYTWGTGSDADFLKVTTVPEPSTWALLSIGAVGAVALRRRKAA